MLFTASARKHRHHIPGVWRTTNGGQARAATAFGGFREAASRTERVETEERFLDRVPNDDDFGSVTSVCDPYLTQMKIGESR